MISQEEASLEAQGYIKRVVGKDVITVDDALDLLGGMRREGVSPAECQSACFLMPLVIKGIPSEYAKGLYLVAQETGCIDPEAERLYKVLTAEGL